LTSEAVKPRALHHLDGSTEYSYLRIPLTHASKIPPIKNILFDLDGTIIEPQEGILNAVIYALNKMDIDEPDKPGLTSFIGPPLIDSFKSRYGLNQEKADEAVAFFRAFFSVKGVLQNTLYDGIAELLQELQNTAVRVFVATSKPTIFADQILKHYNLHNCFEAVIGSNLDNTRKDKTEIIKFILDTHTLDPTETVMIGDTKFDLIGANNNAVPAIAVTYGHGILSELQALNPTHIVADCYALKALLKHEIMSDEQYRNPIGT
jgi:phosphoglycolate phosphatase